MANHGLELLWRALARVGELDLMVETSAEVGCIALLSYECAHGIYGRRLAIVRPGAHALIRRLWGHCNRNGSSPKALAAWDAIRDEGKRILLNIAWRRNRHDINASFAPGYTPRATSSES